MSAGRPCDRYRYRYRGRGEFKFKSIWPDALLQAAPGQLGKIHLQTGAGHKFGTHRFEANLRQRGFLNILSGPRNLNEGGGQKPSQTFRIARKIATIRLNFSGRPERADLSLMT